MQRASIIAEKPSTKPQRNAKESPSAPAVRWQSTLVLAFVGQVLFWAALPPLSWAPLAWLAPVSWCLLLRLPQLSGSRPYRTLWLSSFVFYLAAMYWVTLPHWATAFGWLALSAYLAIYFPLFIGLSRVAVRGLGISSLVAAPVVWTGLDLARGYILGGFGMAALAHTQYRWPALIQISDLAGSYAVGFAIVFVAACLARLITLPDSPGRSWPVAPLAVTLAAIAGYGAWRLDAPPSDRGAKVALVQGSIDSEMKHDPTMAKRIFDQYFGLSQQARREHPDVDLIVWPETMFPYPWFTFDEDFEPPADVDITPQEISARSHRAIEHTVRPLGTAALLGVTTVHEARGVSKRFNTALFVDREGDVLGRYDKSHLVAFGEYVPLATWFPWLYRLTPLPSGLDAGAGPKSVEIAGLRFAPNICYENTVSQLIRGQVNQLREEGQEPDVLVNLTNDGWFWGSAELDFHLACAVFRAIECRKPFLVAANTGFSASIDSGGRILGQGRRRDVDLVITTAKADPRRSWYLVLGDLPVAACLLATVALAVRGWRDLRRKPQAPAAIGV